MCFVDQPEVPAPAPPPQVLDQEAPKKKTAAEPSSANTLAIGTKKYRRESGLGGNALGTKRSPTGINLS